MTKLSRQEVFNIAHSYYARGGETGYDGEACIYFADNGGHCGVGVLLDHLGFERGDLIDEEKDHNEDTDARELIEFLGERFTDHLEPNVFAEEDARIDHASFLMRLQSAHDSPAQYGDLIDVVDSFEAFARKEGVTVQDPKDWEGEA